MLEFLLKMQSDQFLGHHPQHHLQEPRRLRKEISRNFG
jgi:hypothetical protein